MDVEEIVHEIVDSAYKVQRVLGLGFLENVYTNALAYELRKRGIPCEREYTVKVWYEGVEVGHYRADLIVDNRIIVEAKYVSNVILPHELQLVNYLKATGIPYGLLINFASIPIFIKRKFRDPK